MLKKKLFAVWIVSSIIFILIASTSDYQSDHVYKILSASFDNMAAVLYLLPVGFLMGAITTWLYFRYFCRSIFVVARWSASLENNSFAISKAWIDLISSPIERKLLGIHNPFLLALIAFNDYGEKVIELLAQAAIITVKFRENACADRSSLSKLRAIIDELRTISNELKTFTSHTVYSATYRKTPSEVHDWCIPLIKWATKMSARLDNTITELTNVMIYSGTQASRE